MLTNIFAAILFLKDIQWYYVQEITSILFDSMYHQWFYSIFDTIVAAIELMFYC